MPTRDMTDWETSISRVISTDAEEEVIVRGHRLSDLIGRISFAEMMFLMLRGDLPSRPEARVLDALLVASVEHGIAPPSMIARCFASYGTSIQQAVGGGVIAFGDRMGGLGEQLAKLMVEQLFALAPNPGRPPSAAVLEGAARQIVAAAADAGERVPGYGIPLHGADPRAPKMLALAREEGVFGAYCGLAVAIEE